MITKDDIIYFYEKYKENLKKEQQVTADLMQADSQEEWVEKLKQKYRTMKQLYIENEALLNLYVRPFIEGRAELTAEVAQEFLRQIRQAYFEDFEDSLSMMEMAETLEDYFRENGPVEYDIWNLSLLGIFYNNSSEKEEGRKGYEYFEKVCGFRERYFAIEDFEVRKRILYAFYNRPVVQGNFLLAEAEELNHNLEQALEFYNDEKVRALDGERFDFDGLIRELNYDVLGDYVMNHTRETAERWLLERAEKTLGYYYEKELVRNPNPYDMPDEIYCYYRRTLFFLGRISCTEFLEDYKRYCDYCIQNDVLEHLEGFWESRLFQVAVNHLPGILQCLNLYGQEYEGDPTLRNQCVEEYLKIIRRLPRTGNLRFVNDVVERSLYQFMELLTVGEVASDILINVMLNRDEITLIHSQMVSQIAIRILHSVTERRPELLVGTLGCRNILEVLEKRDQIEAFVSQAAKLFDVGKLKDADIVNKQTRQLTEKELQRIFRHPEAGAAIVEKIPALSQFRDVILGHHKSWNGEMGYPESFDNTTSRDRFLIELIHISDCLDAATDFIGRSYRTQKTFEECMEEFIQGKETIYAPELVTLLEEDHELERDLRELLNEGRIRTYYEVYGIALDDGRQTDTEDGRDWCLRLDEELDSEQDEKERLISILHESSRENRDFVQAMVRQSLLTLYVDLRSGRYHVFSRGKQRMFDALSDGKYQEFLTQNLEKIAEPGDWEKIKYRLNISELLHTLARQNGNYECEMRVLLQGEYRWVRMQFMKIDDKNRIPRTMAVLITDVQESHGRSDQMEAVLKDACRTAMEANKAKSVFLSSMSHDIRTPMNGIIGMTRIALQHLEERDRVEDCLKKIDESSRHLMELINEVLDMSRIESGNKILHAEPVQLQELIKGVITVCQPEIQAEQQELTVDIAELAEDCVMVDPVRLRQIFTNILSNAVKYTPARGKIHIEAHKLLKNIPDGNCYQFRIRDNGIGMSEEFQHRLFEPFTREDNSMTNARQGTGLGLSIVKSVVTMMGGTIKVDSVQGKGTMFTVTLPLPAADISETVETETMDTVQQRFDGHRILLAEDNEINREIACELLESRGLVVESVTNGEEAFEKIRDSEEGRYELILMDIQMPVMNGYDATRAIRNLDGAYAKNIPIIALTANIFEDDIMKAIDSGMNEHITKPMDMRVVEKILNKWLMS